MTHESEAPFHERVRDFLEDAYGAENVESNKFLPDPYRFADLWVAGPLFDIAIEVENDFESVTTGVGQAIVYAAEKANAVPVVIVPPDHVDEPEVSSLRSVMPVVELDV